MKTLILGVLFFSTLSSFAQDGNGKRIQQLRIAFITDQLDLSVEEAQQFWPLFNAYHDEKKVLEREIKREKRKLSEVESFSDTELNAYLNIAAKNKASIVKLENNFFQSALTILGSKRTLMLINMEDRFRKRLIKEKLKEKQMKSE